MRRLFSHAVATVRRVGAARATYTVGVALVAVGCSLAWLPGGLIVAGAGAIWGAYDLVDLGDSDTS